MDRVFRAREQLWIVSSDLLLVGATDPRAVELLRVREFESGPGRTVVRYKPTSLGGLAVRQVYVYPERLCAELSDAQKNLLADLYARTPLPVEALPYTDEMDRIHLHFVRQSGVAVSAGVLYQSLLAMRKQSRLVVKSQPPTPTDAALGSPAGTA